MGSLTRAWYIYGVPAKGDTMTTPADFDKAYDYLRANHTRNDFYASLFQQFERKGVLSEKQILAVLRGIEHDRAHDRERVKSEANPVTECGIYRNDKGVFRVKQSKSSKRFYAERFVPNAESKSERFEYDRGAIFSLTPEHRLTLAQAVELGAQHGVCVVCGAELTDPTSIERGIGPVCAKKV
jgi:hypothetical protein